MKILTLIRHAKSSWDDPGLADFDRPLNRRGQRDLPLMVARMQQHGPDPDRLVYSTALRTRQTVAPLIEAFGLADSDAQASDRLYEATCETLLSQLQQQPDETDHLMLVGHNPGLLELAQWLCADAPGRLPTAAIVQLGLKSDRWRDLMPNCAEPLWLDYPKLHHPSSK